MKNFRPNQNSPYKEILAFLFIQCFLLGSLPVFGQDISGNSHQVLEELMKESEIPLENGNSFPPIWNMPVNTGTIHGIIVNMEANPRVNDISLDPGDYIGGFYLDDNGELKCGGADYWQDTANIIFPLFRDDPDTPEKDGFAFGELIYFRLFSWTTMKDYEVDVLEFDPESITTNKWYPLGLSTIIDIQALEQIDFYIQPSGNPVCVGNELVLEGQEFIGSGGPYTFQWASDPPGFNYSEQFPPAINPEETTTFYLTVQDGPLQSQHEITIYVNNTPTADAGNNGQVCANESFQLSATAENYSSVIWTTSGDGTFANPTELNTTYTPGTQDNAAGQAMLTLTVQPLNPCDGEVSDNVQLTVLRLPVINAGEDMFVCTTEPAIIQAEGSYFGNVLWTTNGDGTFSSVNTLETLYYGAGDDFEDGATLSVCVDAQDPCVATTCDQITLSYVPGPTVNAPNNKTRCENQTVSINGIASNYSSIEWTTAGDGTFQNPFAFGTTYYPGTLDRGNGGVVVTLNAYPIGNCGAASKDVNIILVKLPEVITFGPDTDKVCDGDDFMQLEAIVENTNSISWSTNGDGTFNSLTLPNAKYYPGVQDLQNGQFELVLSAAPLPYCVTGTSETQLVTVQMLPAADAGSNAVICEDEDVILADATASEADEILWTTSGDGTFANSANLNTTYFPGTDDIESGNVQLTLTAFAISPCAVDAIDFKELTINRAAEASAGPDAEICETDTYQLNGSVANFASFQWSTNGDGNFSNPNVVNPVYTPGTNDIAGGLVILTLQAEPNAPCLTVAEDFMQLQIQLEVSATAGTDAVICDVENHVLANATASNYETLTWETNGDGTFSNANAVNPTYFPGTSDIESGTVDLTINATAVSPCLVDISDSKILTIVKSAEVNAGPNAIICEDDTYQLNGSAANFASFQWSTNGDGNFSNPNVVNPVYTPGTNDIAGGLVVLTLQAVPNAPCITTATDNMILQIRKSAIVDAGQDLNACGSLPLLITGVTALNYSSLLWTTSGDGTFSNAQLKTPFYFPGAGDISAGSVTLTLSLNPLAPCTGIVTDSRIVQITIPAAVNAGEDVYSCGEPVTVNATASNTASVEWSTSGDGTFDNPVAVSPTYFPGPQDIANMQAVLTISGSSNLPCTSTVSDQVNYTVDEPQVVNDNVTNRTLNEGSTLFLSFSASSISQGQYAWYFNGEVIPGKTSPTLLITGMAPDKAGYYQATYTNNCNTIESNTALVEVLQPVTESFFLSEGWSGFSSFVTPNNPALENVFDEISADVIIMANNDGIFWPGQNINTLGDISVTSGYKIKMANGAALNVAGVVRYPLSELEILPGWTYLPVNTNCPVNIEETFGGFTGITMIKDIAGTGIYWPDFGVNTIGELIPGMAYFILNESGSVVTVKFDYCDVPDFSGHVKSSVVQFDSPWNEISYTPGNHVFGFKPGALAAFNEGDIIGAFNPAGICTGLMRVKHENNVMMVFGDDAVTGTPEGMLQNEVITFKRYDKNSDDIMDLEVVYDGYSRQLGTFVENGISEIEDVRLKITSTGNDLNENHAEINIYPNPTSGQLNITMQNMDVISGKVTVTNMNGQVVMTQDFENSNQISMRLNGLPNGLYYLRVVAGEVVKTEKVVLK